VQEMKLRRLLPPVVAIALLASACAPLSLLFGVESGSMTMSSGSQAVPPSVLAEGRFLRCTSEFRVDAASASLPPDVVDLHAVGASGTSRFPGMTVRFSVVGTEARPRLAVETQIESSHGASESSGPRPSHGPWMIGPVTISADGGGEVVYSCSPVRP